MDRRAFLRAGTTSVAVAGLVPGTVRHAFARPAQEGDGPYGPLGPPDANGVRLPDGFTSRIVARAGQPVGTSAYVWHTFPDGGACFPTDDGGWIYASNSEVPIAGGVGVIRFDADGSIVDAYPILRSTSVNCAGGPTPWNTWLSCEEWDGGRVWECDPYAPSQGTVIDALGTFQHEAAAIDPLRGYVYLTEDKSDGRFYRFVADDYPDITAGTLQVAVVEDLGAVLDGERSKVRWVEVPEPNPAGLPVQDEHGVIVETPTRHQVPGSTPFDGGEGCWYDGGYVYFTTKGDDRVWAVDSARDLIELVYDASLLDDPPLRGVDNITVADSGDLYVAEDGDDMQVVLITPDRVVAPFLQVVGHDGSEIAGPAFDPSGERLYFSSQRGGPAQQGITFEVVGPFRGDDPPGRSGSRALRGFIP